MLFTQNVVDWMDYAGFAHQANDADFSMQFARSFDKIDMIKILSNKYNM